MAEFQDRLLSLLLAAWPSWALAWFASLLLLLGSFHILRPRLRRRALQLDDHIRDRARALRYRGSTPPGERLWLTWFFRFWTNFASAPVLATMSLVLPYVAWVMVPQSLSQWMLPGLCYGGAMLLSYIMKRVIRRVRPPIEAGAFGHRLLRDPSFPSGHSLTSFCFWSMLSISAAHYLQSPVTAAAFALLAAMVVGFTGLSRIYLAVHFPSDVAGGYVIGLVWTCACYFALRGLA